MFKSVTLEVSLKPFKKTDDAYIQAVAEKIFTQWHALIKDSETVSVMLWTSEGSEILDYSGNMDDPFEWACWIGQGNLPYDHRRDEGDDITPHQKKHYYTQDPPVMTYGILKKIVSILRQTGERHLPAARIRIGETFDIGPEFAVSDFKYNRHKEVTEGMTRCDHFGVIDCTALLNADTRAYAAYPNGIPQDTPVGTFLGKQTQAFLTDLGFDYIWFSNGFGFSADPWSLDGKVFDGDTFNMTKLVETRRKVFEFWKYFREGCPDFPVEVRGTNNSVGIDYATDAVPIYEIYKGNFNITPPPNSPWAALNDNYGLEMMGHMTRICELPGEDFMFRFYIHDPWWLNSPWYDRYNSCPTDIYLPMSVTRIDEEGRTRSAELFNILSIDNSFGNMPDACVNEPLPHILKAKKDAGDAPAPLVWVYPMREYSTANDEQTIYEMYYGDRYIMDAINRGFPLNCVVSSDIFLKQELSLFRKSILISPVQENSLVQRVLEDYARSGGKVVFYGSRSRIAGICPEAAAVDIMSSPDTIRNTLKKFGLSIDFVIKSDKKPPTMAISRSNSGLFFSVYAIDTTVATHLKFPLGAPVFLGGGTEIVDGAAVYHFGRCEHRECRFFVKQKDGVVIAYERNPIFLQYRRRIMLRGLQDAEVCFFPETYCGSAAVAGPANDDFGPDGRPEIIEGQFRPFCSEEYGCGIKGEHLTGDFFFYIPREQYIP